MSYRSACQPPENVEVSRHPAAVWPDVFSHGTDERQPLWAVPDALSQPGSVGSFRKGDWSRSTVSNREHAAYKTAALPLRYCGVCPPAAISRQDGPCRVHRRRNTTAVKGTASKLPILKQTLIPNDLLSRSRGLRGGPSHRSKMRFPQPLKAVTSSPSGLFPAVPADSVELAAECSSVRNGRLGNDSADFFYRYATGSAKPPVLFMCGNG